VAHSIDPEPGPDSASASELLKERLDEIARRLREAPQPDLIESSTVPVATAATTGQPVEEQD